MVPNQNNRWIGDDGWRGWWRQWWGEHEGTCTDTHIHYIGWNIKRRWGYAETTKGEMIFTSSSSSEEEEWHKKRRGPFSLSPVMMLWGWNDGNKKKGKTRQTGKGGRPWRWRLFSSDSNKRFVWSDRKISCIFASLGVSEKLSHFFSHRIVCNYVIHRNALGVQVVDTTTK